MSKNSKIQADIRNKLSPVKNLLVLLKKAKKPFPDNSELNVLIEKEIENVLSSVDYLSNFLKED